MRGLQITGQYPCVTEGAALDAPTRTMVVIFQQPHVEHGRALTHLFAQHGAGALKQQLHTAW